MSQNVIVITRLIELIEATNSMIEKYSSNALMSRQYLHQKMKLTQELEATLKGLGIEGKLTTEIQN